jgi:phage terminase small subunit
MEEKKENRGGYREGAGRKPSPVILRDIPPGADPKEYLTQLMQDNSIDIKLRLDAAKALLPYVYKKLGEGGKKEEKQLLAEQADQGTAWENLLN